MGGIDLSETNPSGAYLRGANLGYANISNADLKGTSLIGTYSMPNC
ncbi:MAG: pentapeptide repeat-containing protein [Candidatus Micrarchaeota archaeon]|nr:pentapeptide repeat-containing protein [Candidatus Micrarchaeota archaeon]